MPGPVVIPKLPGYTVSSPVCSSSTISVFGSTVSRSCLVKLVVLAVDMTPCFFFLRCVATWSQASLVCSHLVVMYEAVNMCTAVGVIGRPCLQQAANVEICQRLCPRGTRDDCARPSRSLWTDRYVQNWRLQPCHIHQQSLLQEWQTGGDPSRLGCQQQQGTASWSFLLPSVQQYPS